MDKIKLAQRTISLLSSMIEGGECHTTRTREMKDNALDGLEQLRIAGVSNSKRFKKQDLLRAYQAGAIEQKDNNLKSIDVVTLGNLQEDSQVWYERYIG